MPKLSENIQLSKFGWNGYSISTNLEIIHTQLPTWKALPLLRPPETYDSKQLQFPWRSFYKEDGTRFLPALEIGDAIDAGTYGKIHVTKRAVYIPKEGHKHQYIRSGNFKEIASKIIPIELTESEKKASKLVQEMAYEDEIQAIIYESTLHILIYETFQRKGIQGAIPMLFEVVGICSSQSPTSAMEISSIVMNMEFIRGWTLFEFLKEYFEEDHSESETEMLLIDTLIQLCIYLDILQNELRFNHRDLKLNNVLYRKTPVVTNLQHPSLKKSWTCIRNVVLVDFGFSCIACDEPSRRSILQAGSWFSERHDCMKKGRDIALFLYSLQAYYPLETRVSPAFFQMLNTAMMATQTVEGRSSVISLFQGVTEKGIPINSPSPLQFNDGIYKFLRFSDVEIPGCEPLTFLPILEAYANPKN